MWRVTKATGVDLSGKDRTDEEMIWCFSCKKHVKSDYLGWKLMLDVPRLVCGDCAEHPLKTATKEDEEEKEEKEENGTLSNQSRPATSAEPKVAKDEKSNAFLTQSKRTPAVRAAGGHRG